MGFLDVLMGGRKPKQFDPTLLPNLELLKALPPGPFRDQAMRELMESGQGTSDIAYDQIRGLPGYLDRYDSQLADSVRSLTGIQGQIESAAGFNPYINYYSSPEAALNRMRGQANQELDSAFGRYGTFGQQYSDEIAQINAGLGARNITRSGVGSRAFEDASLRQAAKRNEASAQRNQMIEQNMLKLLDGFNQNQALKGQMYGQSANIGKALADISNQQYNNRLNTGQTLAGIGQSNLLQGAGLETQGRQERIQRDAYNTNLRNQQTIYNNQLVNNAGMMNTQAENSYRASRPGLLSTIGQVAGLVGSIGSMAGGMFGGMGGAAGGLGKASGAIGNVARGFGGGSSSFSPSYDSGSTYGSSNFTPLYSLTNNY